MNSVLSYVRRAGDAHAVVVLNMTPEPRANYRVGRAGRREATRSCSRPMRHALAEADTAEQGAVSADPSPFHGYPQSLSLDLPPLGALVLAPR